MKLAMLQLRDPFDIEGIPFRLRDLLEEQAILPRSYAIMPAIRTGWDYVGEDTLVLRLPEEIKDHTELERMFHEDYGIKPSSTQ